VVTTILVVEDDEDISTVLGEFLGSEGYRVLTAAHGAEALDYVRQKAADVILLDMLMPVMDGATFARAYRELPGPHAPILVLAATNADRRAAEIDAVASMEKPFDLLEMLRIVQQLASVPRARSEPSLKLEGLGTTMSQK
jgi:CheY-like chemotaxis protein